MVRAMINSEKHFVPVTLTTVDGQTAMTFGVAAANADPSVNTQVRIGAIVKAVHVELWYMGSSSQPVFQVSTFEKLVSGQGNPTSAQMSDLHTYPNKKNIFYTTQGLVGDANTNPIPIFRDWIKIPKSKQRIGLGDFLILTVAARGEVDQDLEVCGMMIYKEYF